LRHRAHHLHLRAAALIIFTFAPPRPSSSPSRCRAHHLHLRAAALITFIFAPPRPSSSSRCHAHHLHLRAVAIIMPPPLDLHSFGGSVNSIHPRRHLFIRSAAR
jgi:hypothetical protein